MTAVRGTYVQSGAFLKLGWMGPQPEFERAVAAGVDFVGADAGSTDFGPAYLGSGTGMVQPAALKRLLAYVVMVTRRHGVPLLIGSAGVGGGSSGLASFREAFEQVIKEQDLHLTAAYIDAEQDPETVKAKLAQGRIRPLRGGQALTEERVDAASHIVVQTGAEPYQKALDAGADVIIGGRTSDAALFAAVPLSKGIAPHVAWHMAKVLDHGHFNVEPTPGVSTWSMGTALDNSFEISAANPEGACSALRVARTTLHESPHATRFYEPPGVLDIADCRFEQVDRHRVRVTGSRFTPLPYTLKLEAASQIGYRSVAICGFRAPEVVTHLESALSGIALAAEAFMAHQGVGQDEYTLAFHRYGQGEVLRDREVDQLTPTEVGVVADCVAGSQEIASTVMAKVSFDLHSLGRAYGLAGGPAAFPFSPVSVEAGPVYRFTMWHVMEVDDPFAHCSIDVVRY